MPAFFVSTILDIVESLMIGLHCYKNKVMRKLVLIKKNYES